MSNRWRKKINILTYSNEVPAGLHHHIFVEILLGRIQQSPLFLSKTHIHILIGDCILKFPIYVHNKNGETYCIVVYTLFWLYLHNSVCSTHLFHVTEFQTQSPSHFKRNQKKKNSCLSFLNLEKACGIAIQMTINQYTERHANRANTFAYTSTKLYQNY